MYKHKCCIKQNYKIFRFLIKYKLRTLKDYLLHGVIGKNRTKIIETKTDKMVVEFNTTCEFCLEDSINENFKLLYKKW